MDPVSLVVAAVVAGLVGGMKETAGQVVKDGYAKLKGLLSQRGVDVAALEKRPDSAVQKAALEESLGDALAVDPGGVQDLLDAAQALVKALRESSGAGAGEVVGVDLAYVEAEFIRIQQVRSAGTGINIRHSKTTGGIEIGSVEAGVDKSVDPQTRQ